MPFSYSVIEDAELLVAHASGHVTKDEIVRALDDAVGKGIYRGGMDRITLAERDAQIHELDVFVLSEIRHHILEIEKTAGKPLAFRSAFVSDFAGIAPILTLYKALWDHDRDVEAKFAVFAETADALDWLGRPRDLVLVPGWPPPG